MTPTTFILIGAGNRGRGTFGQYALDNPLRAKFVAVVEPEPARREAFAAAHKIPTSHCFESVAGFFARHPAKIADALVVATPGAVRAEPVACAIRAGYAVLCEKPLAHTAAATIAVTDSARSYAGLFMVCHQMRYAPLYRLLKSLLDSGDYGRVINVEHSENVSFRHMAHTFVRGVYNNDRLAPMILAKSCHDMDLLLYLIGAKPSRVASFGGLAHLRPENAPPGAPRFCLDGCPISATCPYDVTRIYMQPDTDPAYLRQMGVVRDQAHLRELLRTNRYGRCVYRCDNNAPDHQVCSFEFAGGATASFSMTGHNGVERRRTRLMLEDAEIELETVRNTIEIHRFSTGEHRVLEPARGGTHSGGDRAIMDDFIAAVQTGHHEQVLTSVADSLDSHLMAFAAEESRQTGRVIQLADFEDNCRRAATAVDKG
ncbi:MAG: Inositol 2-dehydrogenase/D-chiro-inositol 3-dehydrogenase [Verrucomicrobiae bacterium]|nr:Inositol 2-dehydrogenase/D-chiro-inositol 3-dehydrogenase [Verrucomicrobiae bacterium]